MDRSEHPLPLKRHLKANRRTDSSNSPNKARHQHAMILRTNDLLQVNKPTWTPNWISNLTPGPQSRREHDTLSTVEPQNPCFIASIDLTLCGWFQLSFFMSRTRRPRNSTCHLLSSFRPQQPSTAHFSTDRNQTWTRHHPREVTGK